MNENTGYRIVGMALLFLVAAGFIAIGAYNAGVQHGVMTSGKMVVAAPAVYYGWHPGFPPFFAILALFAIFAVARAALWRGRGWHHHYHHGCCRPEERKAE